MYHPSVYEIIKKEYDVRLDDGTVLNITADEHDFGVFKLTDTSSVWEEVPAHSYLEYLANVIFKDIERGEYNGTTS